MPNIKILVTGGTFDKEYDELQQALIFKQTHVPAVLDKGRCKCDVEVTTLMLKDSLQMTDADRDAITQACQAAPQSRIVITHGTDTMSRTAEYLASRVQGKTIVLTGAMVPYTFGSSDGLFNMGAALALVQALPPGVFVAMNGTYFEAGNVRKNRQTGVFTKLR